MAPVTLQTGSKLGRFVLQQQLGKGAAGVVYLATDTRLQQTVALKVLHAWLGEDPEVLERFKREIVLTRRIAHPGVCRLHDLHEEDGQTFITMEYVEGQTLAAVIHKEGRLSPLKTLEVLRGLAAPLDAAHHAGVVHRDLKPGNVLAKRDGSLCVLDFGMATASDVTKITRAGRTVGSLRFIAPEVWEGMTATSASDCYAVGVIIYACLAGRLPFEAATPAEAFQAQKQELTSLSQHNQLVTPAVNNVVKKMMSRKPGDRYPDVTAMLHAFEAALGSPRTLAAPRPSDLLETSLETVAGTTPPSVGLPTPVGERVPRLALVGAAVVLLIVAMTVIAAVIKTPSPPRTVEKTLPRGALPVAPIDDLERGRDDGDVRVKPVKPVERAERAGRAGRAGRAERAEGTERGEGGGARAAALAVLKKKGLLGGDVPALDVQMARARGLERNGKDASAAWEKAKATAAAQVVDRGFITAKHKRLRFAAESSTADAQSKIGALTVEAEKHVVARNYAAANDRLNRAFALVK